MSVDATAVALTDLKARRNKKLAGLVRLARPAWIIDVKEYPEASTLFFDLIFRPTPGGGWYRRRYEYEGESDVLYHRGEVRFPEADLRGLPDDAEFKG